MTETMIRKATTNRLTVDKIEDLYTEHDLRPTWGTTFSGNYACLRGLLFVDMHDGKEKAREQDDVKQSDIRAIAEHHGMSRNYLAGLEEGFEEWDWGHVAISATNAQEIADREAGREDGMAARIAAVNSDGAFGAAA